MKKSIALFLLTALCAGAQTNGMMRTWTSVNGNEVEGAFLREADGKIYLRRPDGKTIATTRAKLSPDDLAWIDGRAAAGAAKAETFTFPRATLLETNHMLCHRLVKRIILETLTKLKNNARTDKRLAFVIRDALPQYGWAAITADFYFDEKGNVGKIKAMSFTPQGPVGLREAVQMVRDKFVLPFGEQMTVKRVTRAGEACWEVQNPPPYVSRILLVEEKAGQENSTVNSFDFTFPPAG